MQELNAKLNKVAELKISLSTSSLASESNSSQTLIERAWAEPWVALLDLHPYLDNTQD